jgi:hypothetical protein
VQDARQQLSYFFICSKQKMLLRLNNNIKQTNGKKRHIKTFFGTIIKKNKKTQKNPKPLNCNLHVGFNGSYH